MTNGDFEGDPEMGWCRRCRKRCAPDRTLCAGCSEDRDNGYVIDDVEWLAIHGDGEDTDDE